MPKPCSPAVTRRLRVVIATIALIVTAGLPIPPAAGARGATTTVIGTVPDRGQIAQHAGLVVVTQIGEDGRATMAVGGKYGAPVPIKTHTLPPWGQPHIGTSEIGTSVIVYPHCWRKALTTCNLFAFDVTTGTDRELDGEAARRGTAEIEGDMDRGALAIVRWTAKRSPDVPAAGGRAEATTTLLYQPFQHAARELPEPGGQQIDLDRGRIAQVRDRAPSAGACGAPAVEVVDTRGGSRAVARFRCEKAQETLLAPTLFGKQVVWGLRTTAASLLERAPVRGASHVVTAPTGPFALLAPSAPASAFQLRGDVLPALGSDPNRLTAAWTFALSEDLPLQ